MAATYAELRSLEQQCYRQIGKAQRMLTEIHKELELLRDGMTKIEHLTHMLNSVEEMRTGERRIRNEQSRNQQETVPCYDPATAQLQLPLEPAWVPAQIPAE